MTFPMQEFASEFLSFLEHREARLLSWGFYDATFDAAEVQENLEVEGGPELLRMWADVQRQGMDMPLVFDELKEAGLLFALPERPGRFRTRFAETVRLTGRLRQLFKAEQWDTGASLVSDIKLHLRPRQYPRRNVPVADCWKDLAPHARTPDLQYDLFRALAAKRDGTLVDFAGFQRRAFAHILGQYGQPGSSGTVVSAGTGAGKTKAFYVPALLAVAEEVARNPTPFTKVIAIYPRNVLLADQLREALSEALKLVPALRARNARPLTFGALIGQTPRDSDFEAAIARDDKAVDAWPRVSDGYQVPFLKSPQHPESDLVWRDSDRKAGRTCLYRQGQLQPDIPSGLVQLTRRQLQSSPPDVLFLSLEMLNREMGNPEWWSAFGITGVQGRAPRLLLLDEVHAYSGLAGAQAAWVLRRWRHWARSRSLHVVGLSATLRDARKHLQRIAGVDEQHVAEFLPEEGELEAEGMEYNLALKGDPASGSTLLATTIQTGMLLARVQTPPYLGQVNAAGALSSRAFFGRRVFSFSDNLDTLNRWWSDMADAERKRLALLRLPPNGDGVANAPIWRRKREAGQVWDLPVHLRYRLEQSLLVTRCSSQDPGVDTASDFIVATSALEVGYDDPEVAATLHHKRPRSMASFLQRKGRAGRRRGTRPWTVVVLSDYGADRWAFQNAETLFHPQLESIFLPLRNPYVLRIQATQFLIDWLGREISDGSPYYFLSRRTAPTSQQKAIRLLREMLEQGPAWQRFLQALKGLFGNTRDRSGVRLSEDELEAILWEEPRPLLTRAIPTLLRQLESGFVRLGPARGSEDAKRPLPLFLPSATFEDLDVAETRIEFLPGPSQRTKDDQVLGVGHALMESCPGHVSKRYSTGARDRGYWNAASKRLQDGERSIRVEDTFPDATIIEVVDGVAVYQPRRVQLAPAPENVKQTSKATWEWRSRIRPIGAGRLLPLLNVGRWRDVAADCEAFLHREYSGVEVLRYAAEGEFEMYLSRVQEPVAGTFRLEQREGGEVRSQAVGFRQRVDGLRVRLRQSAIDESLDLTDDDLARLRSEYLADAIEQRLGCSVFLAGWLAQTSLGSLAATAVTVGCSLEEAQRRLAGMRDRAAERVLDSAFQVREAEDDGNPRESRLKARVLGYWRDAQSCRALEETERVLWGPATEDLLAWARRRRVASLAQALRVALVRGLSDVTEDDFEVDVLYPPQGGADVFLTELHPGGLGQMEEVVQRLRGDPEVVHEALRHALDSCRREQQARMLDRAVLGATGKGTRPLAGPFESVRQARDFKETEDARDQLVRVLPSAGVVPTRAVTVSIVSRVLRPGSSLKTDAAMELLRRGWARVNRRVGLKVDARVYAYLCVHLPFVSRRLRALLGEVGAGEVVSGAQIHSLVQQLVTQGCRDGCPECLDNPNRYNDFGRPSRALARRWLRHEIPEVRAEGAPEDWMEVARAHLRTSGRVRVYALEADLSRVLASVQLLLAEDIEVEHLLMPSAISQVERERAGWWLTLQLKEYGLA